MSSFVNRSLARAAWIANNFLFVGAPHSPLCAGPLSLVAPQQCCARQSLIGPIPHLEIWKTKFFLVPRIVPATASIPQLPLADCFSFLPFASPFLSLDTPSVFFPTATMDKQRLAALLQETQVRK